MYTLIIKKDDGTSSDYSIITDEEYKAIMHICTNGIPRYKDCLVYTEEHEQLSIDNSQHFSLPRKPINLSYNGHDCESYGQCPICGRSVVDGMFHTDNVCPSCGLALTWS